MTVEIKVDFNMKERVQRAQFLVEQIWSSNSALRNVNIYPVWIGDTNYFWYVKETSAGKNIRLVNAAEGANISAFDQFDLASQLGKAMDVDVDPDNIPFSGLEISLDTTSMKEQPLLNVNFTAFDKCWSFDVDSGGNQELTLVSESNPVNQIVSPNGQWAVFKRDFNLWLRDLNSGEEKALTNDGTSDFCRKNVDKK